MEIPRTILPACLAIAALWCGSTRAGEMPEADVLAALHWYPETASGARNLTAAAALYLADAVAVDGNWHEGVESRRLQLRRLALRHDPRLAVSVDGRFGYLVLAGEISRLGEAEVESERALAGGDPVQPLPDDGTAAHRAASLLHSVALGPGRVWAELYSRLERAGIDTGVPDDWWGPALAAWEQSEEVNPAGREYALAQAGRVQELAAGTRTEESVHLDLALGRAEWNWRNQRRLAGVWQLLDAVVSVLDQSPDAAARAVEVIHRVMPEDPSVLRHIDPALPVVMALIQDSADELAAGGNRQWARSELAHAYARLALFLPDADFYLDQPVRQNIIDGLAYCVSPGVADEPIARPNYEACLGILFNLLHSELGTDELTGGADGPFAEEFLNREMELATWQRVDYLAGHLAWMMGRQCRMGATINVLEWSLLTELLARWVPLRTVYFGASRWQGELDAALGMGQAALLAHSAHLECLIGRPAGGASQDPMQRLFADHRRLLRDLEVALAAAIAQFRENHLQPGADVVLEPGFLRAQTTAYRPENLVIVPCDPATSCGTRVSLPVSRALIGLFPNGYLLADQLRMGTIGICYDQVQWVSRRQAPARARDPNVANYFGHLSFELVGQYVRDGDLPEEVFRLRLTDEVERLYLFSSADPEMLELACPAERIGEPIPSELADNGPGLVPRRLTYFTSAQASPGRLLTANWERGAEWRDWFVAGGEQIEVLATSDDQALLTEAHLRLEELAGRRERLLTQRMLRQPAVNETDPLTLAASRLEENVAFLRRVAEIYYPVQMRHDPQLRAALVGHSGLLGRDRLRSLREARVPMADTAAVGVARLEALENHWRSLQEVLRTRGQAIPELIYGIELLRRLDRLTLPDQSADAGAEDPRSSP